MEHGAGEAAERVSLRRSDEGGVDERGGSHREEGDNGSSRCAPRPEWQR